MARQRCSARLVSSCFTLVVAAMGFGCAGDRPAADLGTLSDRELLREMPWAARDRDGMYGPAGRSEEIDRVREEIVARNPGWSEREVSAVREGRVELGMTKVQVVAALGWPNEAARMWWRPRRPIGMDGDSAAYHRASLPINDWSYGRGAENLWVYFDGGRVVRIRDNATGREIREAGVWGEAFPAPEGAARDEAAGG